MRGGAGGGLHCLDVFKQSLLCTGPKLVPRKWIKRWSHNSHVADKQRTQLIYCVTELHVILMDNLINSPQDVAYLHYCGIIEHWLGSDAEVVDLFNKGGIRYKCLLPFLVVSGPEPVLKSLVEHMAS